MYVTHCSDWLLELKIAKRSAGHDAGRPLFGAKYCGGQNEVSFLLGVYSHEAILECYSFKLMFLVHSYPLLGATTDLGC